MKKRLLSTWLVCMLCMTTFAQRFSYTYKGIEFKCKVEGRSVCITSFDTKADVVVIPAQVSNRGTEYPVKSVSTFLNGNNYLATSLELEDGIEEIDKFSFNEFRKLRTVVLPASIKVIGRNAFRLNSSTRVSLPNTINLVALEKGNEFHADGTIYDNQPPGNTLAQNTSAPKAEKQKKEKGGALLGGVLGTLGGKKQKDGTEPAQPQLAQSTPAVKEQPVAVKPVLADVDMNIPTGSSKDGEDIFCVIIANEKYTDVPEVEFAEHDGEVFKEYCMKTLGVPEKHIRTFLNASFTDMKRALNWMDNMAAVTAGNGRFIFYYAGHGVPSEKDNSAYLIPADGFPKDITTCFKLSDVYARLGTMKAQNVTCFLDACFSGVKRGEGSALVASRGVAIKAKKENLTGNLVVISAASDDETAYSYKEKGHGMFTYFLLKKLKDSKGSASLGELFEAISSNVMRNSMIENDKLQTPSVNTSAAMKDTWQKIHF